MTKSSELDLIKAVVHRRGTPTAPEIAPMVAELRTPETIPVQPPDQNIKLYDFSILVEWTFGVSYSDQEALHQFLKNNDDSIANDCAAVTGGEARYMGTWWISGIGPSTHRTLWQFKDEQAIVKLKAGLRSSQSLRNSIKQLRSYWKNDPGRTEQVYQPAALFPDLAAASKLLAGAVDPLVELTLEPQERQR
jgi:hypothetical protein